MDNNAAPESRYAVSWIDENGSDHLALYPDTDKGLADARICMVAMCSEEPERNPELVHVTKTPVPAPSL